MAIKPIIQPIFTRDVTKPVTTGENSFKKVGLEQGPNGEMGFWTRNGGDDVFFTPLSQKKYTNAEDLQAEVKSVPISRSGINEKDSFVSKMWIG